MIDPRLKNLSYSSSLTLSSCPRKFELYKLGGEEQDNDLDGTGSITLNFGSTVGLGLQLAFIGKSEEQCIWEMFLNWDCDLLSSDDRRDKSFPYAVIAIQRLIGMSASGFLSSYEVAEWEGKPAMELGFIIDLPNGFKYRGFADLVLVHKLTNEVVVLEAKTTWWKGTNPAKYKNSSQAIGYSVVLDKIFPGLSSYKVVYIEYQTKDLTWNTWDFPKTLLQRAQWLQTLIFDMEDVIRYHEASHFPMRGQSCLNFNRECEYFQNCKMSNRYTTKPLTAQIEEKLESDDKKYQIRVSINELIESQINRIEE